MENQNCPFCKINEEKNRIIGKTKKTIIILSNPSLVKRHLLVIPKRHVEKLSELNKGEKEDLFSELEKFQEILLKKFPGCDIRQNYRPFIPQGRLKINHLHFHLIPREFKDKIYEAYGKFQDAVFKDLNKKELDEAKNFILESEK